MAATKAAVRQLPGLSYNPRISILGVNTKPDNSGNCWAEPYSILATNDVWDFYGWRFGASNSAEPTTRIGLSGQFDVPQNYVGTPIIVPIWATTVTAGSIVWDFDYRTVAPGTSMDQTGVEETASITGSSGGTAHRRLAPTITTLTAANFTPGETVEFTLFRDGTDAADTMAASAFLFDLMFQYAGSL